MKGLAYEVFRTSVKLLFCSVEPRRFQPAYGKRQQGTSAYIYGLQASGYRATTGHRGPANICEEARLIKVQGAFLFFEKYDKLKQWIKSLPK